MNDSHPDPKLRRQLETLLSKYIDEELDREELEELRFLLRDRPENRKFYLQYMDMQAAFPAAISSTSEHSQPSVTSEQSADWMTALAAYSETQEESNSTIGRSFGSSLAPWSITVASLAASFLFAIAFYVTRPSSVTSTIPSPHQKHVESASPSDPQSAPVESDKPILLNDVVLTQAAGAELYGEFLPPLGERLQFNHEYALTSGMIGIRFPDGAEVILEAPSIVKIVDRDRLVVITGHCSVHAPPGAEGFQVETPQTEITNLGTRFSVTVSEVGETDVQVIDGLAEVVSTRDESATPIRLSEREARRFNGDVGSALQPLEFNPDEYRSTLPDRVVSYEVSTTDEGYAWELQSVTVQRDGLAQTFPVDDLIGVQVNHFRAGEIKYNVTVPVGYEGDRLVGIESDTLLHTGVINPGGSTEPLRNHPVLAGDESTPGMALQFSEPVVNRPGPDVVFFELQMATNPPEGDAFHVSPLRFENGLRSHTIHRYDITMTSREARLLPDIDLFVFSKTPLSLESLKSGRVRRQLQTLRFRALAVGIDLSDLGYDDGAAVEGLFFQDILDDDDAVDPVFVAGLPANH